jgi:hypothetical protein
LFNLGEFMQIKNGDKLKWIGDDGWLKYGDVITVTDVSTGELRHDRLNETSSGWYLSNTQRFKPVYITEDIQSDQTQRKDAGKLRMDLIPPEWLIELSKVLTFGAKKYEANGWKEGMNYSRCLAALKRHLVKWELGETLDDESKCHHLSAVAWNALALMYYDLHERSDLDDRQKNPNYDSDLNFTK